MRGTKSRIPVIYILSNGRSGSTLLDLLLGAHSEVWTLGEAQILPWEVRENRLPCGCGVSVNDCDFWQSVLINIPINKGRYPIEYFREKHNSGKTLRWNHLYDIIRRTPSKKWSLAVDEYGKLNAQYLEAVWRAAEGYREQPIRWLVDASKDLYRLFWLQHSGYFDLRVIHLMKDPRAFVYSMTKKLLPGGRRKVIRFTGRWLVENWLYSYLCNDPAFAGRSYRLRYEDLASQPAKTMTLLGDRLSLDFSDVSLDSFRQYENHAVAGNPMRWQSSTIQLDEKWRQSLPKNHARLTWVFTRLLAQSYGYR